MELLFTSLKSKRYANWRRGTELKLSAASSKFDCFPSPVVRNSDWGRALQERPLASQVEQQEGPPAML